MMIEKLNRLVNTYLDDHQCHVFYNSIGEFLYSNNVVQLPCKIGDTVYCVQPYDTLTDKLIVEGSVWRIVYEGENRIFVLTENGVWPIDEVFMSRRAAELHIETFIKKLKEMIE